MFAKKKKKRIEIEDIAVWISRRKMKRKENGKKELERKASKRNAA